MLTTPKVPWFVILALAIAAVAVWERTASRKQRQAQRAAAEQTNTPLPPPAPTLELVAPQRGSTFDPGAPILHQWTPVPQVNDYLIDFAHPKGSEVCRFDAARPVRGAQLTLAHDDASPCTVWRVRAAGGLIAGGTYSVGHLPGCTLPPSAMVACLEGTTAADLQAAPDGG